MPKCTQHSHLTLQRAWCSTGTAQAGQPSHMPGVPGYRGRLQCQATEAPSRQTGQTADHARGMV